MALQVCNRANRRQTDGRQHIANPLKIRKTANYLSVFQNEQLLYDVSLCYRPTKRGVVNINQHGQKLLSKSKILLPVPRIVYALFPT